MDFSLPPVGEGLYEVELVRWLVRPGDINYLGPEDIAHFNADTIGGLDR